MQSWELIVIKRRSWWLAEACDDVFNENRLERKKTYGAPFPTYKSSPVDAYYKCIRDLRPQCSILVNIDEKMIDGYIYIYIYFSLSLFSIVRSLK